MKGDCDERGTEVLLDVKLRAASRQSDAQAAGHVQATDPRSEADSVEGWLLRVERQRQTGLLQARNGQVPRRAVGRGRRRRLQQEITPHLSRRESGSPFRGSTPSPYPLPQCRGRG